jgi:hypothetical protein
MLDLAAVVNSSINNQQTLCQKRITLRSSVAIIEYLWYCLPELIENVSVSHDETEIMESQSINQSMDAILQ